MLEGIHDPVFALAGGLALGCIVALSPVASYFFERAVLGAAEPDQPGSSAAGQPIDPFRRLSRRELLAVLMMTVIMLTCAALGLAVCLLIFAIGGIYSYRGDHILFALIGCGVGAVGVKLLAELGVLERMRRQRR
jgi:hypothetical protein